MYFIFAFGSRTNAIKFYESLHREGIDASLMNTPRAAGVGCGLSVKTEQLTAAKRVLASGGYQSFYGVFSSGDRGDRITRLS